MQSQLPTNSQPSPMGVALLLPPKRGGLVKPPVGVGGLGAQSGAQSRETPENLNQTCARCGAPCERWPGPTPLCNRCALELGQQEVAERQATPGGAKGLPDSQRLTYENTQLACFGCNTAKRDIVTAAASA